MVVKRLMSAGQLAFDNDLYHHRIYPAITVVVNGGWSKRTHKHSYNAKPGVGMILVQPPRNSCILVSGTNTAPSKNYLLLTHCSGNAAA